jgi:hypothetical protein
MGVMRIPSFSCLTLLALAACGGRDPVDDKANRTAGLPDVSVAAPSAAGEPHADTRPATPLPAGERKIPAGLQGRWGLTPADCMPERGDAKGLLVVTSDDLHFYESRAVPAADAVSDGDSISGNFAFTGEGQSWTKYEALKVDKAVLMRTETKPSASFSYAKCS